MRAIAVTLVIIAHAIDSIPIPSLSFIKSFYYFENFGAIGVDIFFVISGVIITVITATNKQPPKLFFIKRCIRILPLYWGLSLFCYLISLAGFWHTIKTQEIIETIVLLPLVNIGAFDGPILFLGWTLAFEFLFYIIFAVALFVTKKKPLIVVFLIIAFLLLLHYLLTGNTTVRFVFITNPILLEFLMGCVCGYIYLNFKFSTAFNYILIAVGIVAILITIFIGFGNISQMNYTRDSSLSLLRVIKWGIPSFLLITGIIMLEKNNCIKIPALLVTAGNISYAAYLTHIFSIVLVRVIWQKFALGFPDFFIVVAVIFSLLVAYLVYYYIEKPVTHYLNNMLLKKSNT